MADERRWASVEERNQSLAGFELGRFRASYQQGSEVHSIG